MVKFNMRYEAPAVALEKWNPTIKAAKEDETSINIYSTIGEYGDGGGMTPKIVSSVLRRAEGKDVTVNINSPGGDFFDGLAIYSLLKEYEGNVKVKVLGMAASAASVVALAGDEIEIAEQGFFMIHNSWTVAMGNRHGMKEVAARLEKFDASMRELYAEKTGMDEKKIAKMMDEETWIAGKESVEMGFASAILGGENIEEDEELPYNSALKRVDVALAKAGVPRSERRAMIKDLTGTPCAAEPTPCAGDDELKNALSGLLNTITS
jgi:ATP-dependent Clp protease protease subunit